MKQRRYWITFTATCLFAGMALYFVSRSRTFQLFGGIVSKIDTDKRIVALTFDDGPAANTDSILQILDQYNVKATFFLTGEEMANHPELTRKIIGKGHCLGNHSYSHQRMMLKGQQFIRNEIEKTDSLIRAFGYTKKIYFRPPYCKKLFYLPYYLHQTNRTTVTWNVEPDSDDQHDAQRVVKHFIRHVKPRAIVLLHGMYKDRKATLEALPGILQWLKDNNYTMVTLDALDRTKP
jgi:peptidoglycan/xylan/chitin deacetylase (PgdA/CDA1 family)